MEKSELQKHFKSLADKWPSGVVARKSIGEFSGGLISPGRLANLDSLGEGPPVRIRFGRHVAYPVGDLINWFVNRSEMLRRKKV